MSDFRQVVHIVDDDPAVCDSVCWLLDGEGFFVQAHDSAEAFLRAFGPEQPGCLLLDVRMPGLSGLQLQDQLARRGVLMPVIFVTAHGDIPLAVDAMRRGAVDFLQKPFDDEALIGTVRRALAMEARQRSDAGERAAVVARMSTLSAREREVLAEVVDGRPNKLIADRLGISIKTVEAHRASMMEKLGAASLAHLVRLIVAHRLLDPGQSI